MMKALAAGSISADPTPPAPASITPRSSPTQADTLAPSRLAPSRAPSRFAARLTPHLVAYITLTKPRIVGLLLVTTLPAMFLAHNGVPSTVLIVATIIGGALAAMGANVANMVIDRDIDLIMQRTATRPLPTGAVTPKAAILFAMALEILALLVFVIWVNVLSAALALSAAAFYIGIYTIWLKRRSPLNIVIGGAAGAVPPLVGWAAVRNSVSLSALLLFAIIFFWTPPHFWALAFRYRHDYKAANVPMLTVVSDFRDVANRIVAYTIAVVALSLTFALVAEVGAVYLASAAVLGVAFIVSATQVRRKQSDQSAMQLFFLSMLYLMVLFGAIATDVLLP